MSDEHAPAATYAYADPYRANAGWPAPPGTPMWGIPAVPSDSWGGLQGTPWATSGAVLTPMFSATTVPPAWPSAAPSAVTQVPIPPTVAQGNDEWVHVQPATGWDEQQGSSSGFDSPARSLSRALSRRSSSRSRSRAAFSGDSSPSSATSDLSRTRSFTSSVSENDKRPPREWRSDFSMLRSPTLGAAIGSLLHLSPGRRPSSRRGMSRTVKL
jgi:hypothetical protein